MATKDTPRPYACVCGSAGGDLGELEEHIMTFPSGHEPANPEHTTDRMNEHVKTQERAAQVRAALAKAAGVSVADLRSVLGA